jgi:hypothetical protein
MKTVSFGKYTAPNVDPVTTDLDGWTPIEGQPSMKTWLEHIPADGKFLTGYWEATPGTYKVTYNADEMVHMFEGKATLTDANGNSVTYQGGDSFMVEAGFSGTWKTEETVRKIFAIRLGEGVEVPFAA